MIAANKLNEEEIMILKGTLTAALVAAVLSFAPAFAPAPASADTNVRVGVGFGFHASGVCSGRYGHGRRCWPRYRRGHWVPYYYPYRAYRHSPAYRGFACHEAKWILREHGFGRISTRSCGGRYHVLIGWRNGHSHLIRVRRGNGAIVSVRHI